MVAMGATMGAMLQQHTVVMVVTMEDSAMVDSAMVMAIQELAMAMEDMDILRNKSFADKSVK